MDPICCNFCMVLPMFLRLVLANSLFPLLDINLTLGLLPSRRHAVWRDSVGVESSGSELAYSRRSDSGERCEVKGARKNFHRLLYFAPLSTI